MKRHKNITWFELVKYNTSLKGLLRQAFENLRPITFKGPVHLAPKRKLSICFEGVLALETWSFEFLPCGRFIKSFCYIARNFFSTARGLIGNFEVTWHLTIKLFPDKISERETLQKIYDVRGLQCNVTRECWPMTAVTARLNEYPPSKFPAV